MTERLIQNIELLAPAKDAATAIAAIDHGADAVYMGPAAFGARSQAGNSLADIARVTEYAHQFGAKVYATVNTIIFDDELEEARHLCWELWRVGVDALIVQDLALTRMDLPPIALHASTQCDTRTPEKALFLKSLGFTRIVLARELSLNEIRSIYDALNPEFALSGKPKFRPTDLEVFVHGALCVSYSGDCQASYMLTGRSANRGECCQVCRFKFDLEDRHGNNLLVGKHLLSLKDMNRLNQLEGLLEAGATSLKIEGRLKDQAYVKNVVAAYRAELDRIIAANPDKYRRSSQGISEVKFHADPALSFNRGFTDYFLRNLQPIKGSLASINTPKWIGQEVAVIKSVQSPHGKSTSKAVGQSLIINAKVQLHNGDGLGYFTSDGDFRGFRLNRVDGNRIYPASLVEIAPGTKLYRNADKVRDDLMAGETATRKIPVTADLSVNTGNLTLTFTDADGINATVAEPVELQSAKSPQSDRRKAELQKLGDTIYKCVEVRDHCGDLFIPASLLSKLRRKGIEMLAVARKAAFRAETPGVKNESLQQCNADAPLPTRHTNIANRLSAKLFSEITGIAPDRLAKATEVAKPVGGEVQVMECRYCVRRELGACLKTPSGKSLPTPLFLTSAGNRWRLDFDCANCRMKVIANPVELVPLDGEAEQVEQAVQAGTLAAR